MKDSSFYDVTKITFLQLTMSCQCRTAVSTILSSTCRCTVYDLYSCCYMIWTAAAAAEHAHAVLILSACACDSGYSGVHPPTCDQSWKYSKYSFPWKVILKPNFHHILSTQVFISSLNLYNSEFMLLSFYHLYRKSSTLKVAFCSSDIE